MEGFAFISMSPNSKFLLSRINPNTGAWVLENGFSIETGEWDELKQQVDEAHQLVLKEYRVEDIYKAIDNRGKELGL